jgi:diacylglycerol kinase family enzyme
LQGEVVSGRGNWVARVWAWCALLSGVGAVVALAWLLVADLVTLGFVVLALAVAAALGWVAVTRIGAIRRVAAVFAVAALAGGVVALVVRGALDELAGFVVAGVAFVVFTRAAIRSSRRPQLRPAAPSTNGARPRRAGRAVLLMNPRSGGGKVERFELVVEAERRGVEAVVLRPGDDLSELAREAAGSAEVIGMAGGDGSQALVAQVAMEHGVDFVCVPAGTRNHLALDLGLDRGDVVGALDAFASGMERTIDLAFVNDRVFVNNVSLGIYAEIVQSEAYRDAKLETAEKMLPDLLGPRAAPFDLRFLGPDGRERSAQLLLVSNNPYVLDALVGSGSRPRMDTGELGIVAIKVKGAAAAAKLVSLEAVRQIRRFEGWDEWTADRFQVDSGSAVAAGIDGEAAVLEPPLRFTITPAALRVRLPPTALGLSPAALRGSLTGASLRELWEIATARG